MCAAIVTAVGAPAARATTINELGSVPGADAVFVADVSQDGRVLVNGYPQALKDPASLFLFGPSAAPLNVTTARGRFVVDSLSDNGAFMAWAEMACDVYGTRPTHPIRVHVRALDNAMPARPLTVPARFSRADVQRISVSPAGRITVLVSTYNSPCTTGGSSSGASDRLAVLSAAPGATSLQEIASATLNRAGAEASSSLDGSTFALCYASGRALATANLVSIHAGDQLTVRRIAARQPRRGAVGCAAANSGAATLLFGNPSKKWPDMLTLGSGRTRRIKLPRDMGPWSSPVMSPSGKQAVVADRKDDLWIVGLGNGGVRHVRAPLRHPNAYSGLDNGAFTWPSPHAILQVPIDNRLRAYPLSLNPKTGRWSKLISVGEADISNYCALPSGRILWSARGERSQTLYLSDAARTRITPVDTQSVGTINGVYCAAHSGDVHLSVGKPATLFSVAAASIDGSAWTR